MTNSLALVAFLTVAVGCVPPPAAGTGPGYQAGPQPDETAAAPEPSGTTCIEIVQCLAGCGQDTECFPACVAQGDPASQAAVGALLECNAAGGSECTAELDACRATGGAVAAAPPPSYTTPSAMQPGQPVATENALSWLTGEWTGNNHQFVFYGDGRVRRSDGFGVTYGTSGTSVNDTHCVSVANDTGTVTQQGDLLIMVFASSNTNHCGEKTHAEGLTIRYRVSWEDNHYDDDPNLQIVLTDIDCTNGPMWCADALTRRK